MENNNDNNLFTNMFGIESEEQPIAETPVAQQTPIVEQPVVKTQPVPEVQPVVEQQISKPVVEEIITLDSNKPIEQPVVEPAPSLETINMNPNYQPVKPSHQTNEIDDLDFDTSNNTNYKGLAIILGITLVVVLLAFPLYTGLNNYLSKNKEEAPQDNPPVETPTTNEPTPEEPTLPPINFDMDLSFDKGYTNNPNEYHQTVAYKPEQYEGVIKCENIRTMTSSEGQVNIVIYLYYKDLMLKKYMVIDDLKLNNVKSYNDYISYYQSLESLTSNNEHLYTRLLVSNGSYRINFSMLVDLAYNQAIRVPDEKIYYDVEMSYNTPIKNAMNKYLTNKSFSRNMYCSTLATNDASI